MTAKRKKDETNFAFDADVARLLDIVINALYSNKDVFLRELVANASDACDKHRLESLSNKNVEMPAKYQIDIKIDRDARTLTVCDNGIGMNYDDLMQNLGTIASSGTAALMESLKQKKEAADVEMIGQFGVGFYASFMAASEVEVLSRKAGEIQTWHWASQGAGDYSLKESEQALDHPGTQVVLHMKDDASDYLLDEKIREVIATYADHINAPIILDGTQINDGAALWTKPKNEITPEQYNEFYRNASHGMDEPMHTIHWRAEGVIEYTGLLFIPNLRPWDLYDPGRKHAVRLYVKRVFISDDVEGLMYPWLRFVRGLVDSSDLPLNISRETLQHNPLITKIRSGVAKKILSELDKFSRDHADTYAAFWGQFGAVLKEGLYDAADHREALFKICKFYSTYENAKTLTSLSEYVERMPEGQDKIYYISGENKEHLLNSPQLEGFSAKGYEVLCLTDTIDDFWLQSVGDFEGKAFQSVTQGTSDFAEDKADDEAPVDNNDAIKHMRNILDDKVATVRASKRLTSSAVCLVADDGAADMNMERVLKLHQNYDPNSKRVLEVNMDHALLKKIGAMDVESVQFKDAVMSLYDQAVIIQGEPVDNPSEFARRMADYMQGSL